MKLEAFKIAYLSNILKKFCTNESLPFMSADDLLHDPTIIKTPLQTKWLQYYSRWWDECITNPQTKEKHHGF
jgi:hypothetical protein